MNKNILIVIAFIALASGTWFLFLKSKPEEKKSAETSPVMTKSYSLDEVAKHSTEQDCWMVIESKVYNVTDFIPNHPGGKAILKGCGKDATVLFEQRPDTDKGPHPEAASRELEKLYIGNLKT